MEPEGFRRRKIRLDVKHVGAFLENFLADVGAAAMQERVDAATRGASGIDEAFVHRFHDALQRSVGSEALATALGDGGNDVTGEDAFGQI